MDDVQMYVWFYKHLQQNIYIAGTFYFDGKSKSRQNMGIEFS